MASEIDSEGTQLFTELLNYKFDKKVTEKSMVQDILKVQGVLLTQNASLQVCDGGCLTKGAPTIACYKSYPNHPCRYGPQHLAPTGADRSSSLVDPRSCLGVLVTLGTHRYRGHFRAH